MLLPEYLMYIFIFSFSINKVTCDKWWPSVALTHCGRPWELQKFDAISSILFSFVGKTIYLRTRYFQIAWVTCLIILKTVNFPTFRVALSSATDLQIWFCLSECKISARCIISQNVLETRGSFLSISQRPSDQGKNYSTMS